MRTKGLNGQHMPSFGEASSGIFVLECIMI